MSKVYWIFAPEDAEFYADGYFRKNVNNHVEFLDKINGWRISAYSFTELTTAPDFELRPISIPEATPDVTTGALGKAINQAELLHKKYKTSVDFLNIVKDIQVERGAEYEQEEGERSFEKIATVFNTYTGKYLLPSDIALILEILKNVRFYAQEGYHSDSVIDKVSYGSLWAELVTQERA